MSTRRTAGALLLGVVLTGCSGGTEFSSGDQGYVSGDGTVTVLEEEAREAPVGEVAGRDVDGGDVALSDYRGKVVVMPVWGSWCGPCRAEAPMLADAARDLEDDGVAFLGINSRDHNEVDARQFVEDFGLPYPSIYDPAGETFLALRGTLTPQSIPGFVIVDPEGRVAARVLGEIDRSTLYGVVEDVLGRPTSGPA